MVCVFARKTSEPLTSLVKQIDKKIGENARSQELRRDHDDEGRRQDEETR